MPSANQPTSDFKGDNLSLKMFGIKPGDTNCGVKVQAALTAMEISGAKGITVPPGTYGLGTTGFTIDPDVIKYFWMEPGAKFTYSGTGAAVTVDGGDWDDLPPVAKCHYRIEVERTAADWDAISGTGTDATSYGIVLRNARHIELIPQVKNFYAGLQLWGDHYGVEHVHVHDGYIEDCMVGYWHHLTAGSPISWTNKNTVNNLRIRINYSGHSYATGTVAVTNGSDAVTLTGGTWSAALDGRKFRAAGVTDYTFTRTGNTTGTLDRPYEGVTNATATYRIGHKLTDTRYMWLESGSDNDNRIIQVNAENWMPEYNLVCESSSNYFNGYRVEQGDDECCWFTSTSGLNLFVQEWNDKGTWSIIKDESSTLHRNAFVGAFGQIWNGAAAGSGASPLVVNLDAYKREFEITNNYAVRINPGIDVGYIGDSVPLQVNAAPTEESPTIPLVVQKNYYITATNGTRTYSTGTVNVTNGSASISGNGTTWTSEMDKAFIDITDNLGVVVRYVFNYVGATSATLTDAATGAVAQLYVGADDATATYTITSRYTHKGIYLWIDWTGNIARLGPTALNASMPALGFGPTAGSTADSLLSSGANWTTKGTHYILGDLNIGDGTTPWPGGYGDPQIRVYTTDAIASLVLGTEDASHKRALILECDETDGKVRVYGTAYSGVPGLYLGTGVTNKEFLSLVGALGTFNGDLKVTNLAGSGTRAVGADSTGQLTITSVSATPSGSAGGDLSGTYPNPSVATVGGSSAASVSGHLSNTSNPHSVTANQVLPSLTGNAGKTLKVKADESGVEWV